MIYLVMGLIAGFSIGLGAAAMLTANHIEPLWDTDDLVLPAPSDIQELLNRLEPEPRLKVDGVIGPQTISKWNRIYCEVSAKQ